MPEDSTFNRNNQQDRENLLIFFQFFELLGDKQKRIIWTLHDLYLKWGHVFIGRDKLAKVIPCCREHISRTTTRLQELGYIKKTRRRRMTNVYHLGKILTNSSLKKQWKEYLSQSGEVTSKVTSRISSEWPPDKPSEVPKTPPPYLPQEVTIRITNTENRFANSCMQRRKIKEAFEGFDFPLQDKITFSRCSDAEIELALIAFGDAAQKGVIKRPVKYMQKCLHLARIGKLNAPRPEKEVPNSLREKEWMSPQDALTFSKYSECEINDALERWKWYSIQPDKEIQNPVGLLHAILKREKMEKRSD